MHTYIDVCMSGVGHRLEHTHPMNPNLTTATKQKRKSTHATTHTRPQHIFAERATGFLCMTLGILVFAYVLGQVRDIPRGCVC